MYTHAKFLTLSAVVGSISIAPGFAQSKSKAEKKPMNVLFLVSDDMRTDLSAYGHATVHSPNLDKLAKQGVLFERAYCQYPLSCPSRTSILTGQRPTTTGVYTNYEWFGATYPDLVSLPKYFRQHGYVALKTGKIFHGTIDDTEAWTEGGVERAPERANPVNLEPPSYISPASYYVSLQRRMPKITPGPNPNNDKKALDSDRWEAVEGAAAKQLGDTKIGDQAIEYIQRCKKTGQPFFIACGFNKPHSPFIAPKEFFDLYQLEDIPLPPDFASLPMIPPGFPEACIATQNSDQFINRNTSPEEAREYIRGYLACISYVDWNVGRVIAELERQGLRENTIIVFWGDHGYMLSEKGKWSKHNNLWEQSTRVPFMIYDPRAKGNGKSSPRIVELLDIYPTLVDLCGLPPQKGLDGVSLAPLLDNPNKEWNRPAYTVITRGKGINGVAVRTERWRYAEFFGVGAGAFLTDPINDPHELRNMIYDPKLKDVVEELHKLAAAHVEGKTELSAPK